MIIGTVSRVTLREEPNSLRLSTGSWNDPFSESLIDKAGADYEVSPSELRIPHNVPEMTYGQQVSIYRISDRKRIAYAQYYWNSGQKLECPPGADRQEFLTDFIATALNLPKH